MRAEADAEGAHAGARFLVEAAHLLGDLGAVDDAEILDQAEGDAARRRRQRLGGAEVDQRLQQRLDLVREPEVDPRLRPVRAGRLGQRVVGEQDEARLQRARRRRRCGRSRAPRQRSVPSEASTKSPFGERRDLLGALGDLAGERLLRRGAERLDVGRRRRVGVRREAEPGEPADMLALDQDVAGRRDLGFEHRVLFQAAHQHAGPAVDEPLRQPLMQRIRQPILDRARAFLPMRGSSSQFGRLATKVQVRICAMRLESVSMSPSVRSA